MEWNGCIKMMQGYLEDGPVIVLGSGASVPYGLPSMAELADEIKQDSIIKTDPNYIKLCEVMDQNGLEVAIDTVELKQETLNTIRITVWKAVNAKDWSFFLQKHYFCPRSFESAAKKSDGTYPE